MVEKPAINAPSFPMCGYQIAKEIGGKKSTKDSKMFLNYESFTAFSPEEIEEIPFVTPVNSNNICYLRRPKRSVFTVSSWQKMQDRMKVASLLSEANIFKQFS